MRKEHADGSELRPFAPAYFGVVAGIRWVILVGIGLSVLVAAAFGGLPAAIITTVLGIVVTHFLQRQREMEAEERRQDREIKAEETLKNRELAAALRQQKIEGYQRFMDGFFDTVLERTQRLVFQRMGLTYEADIQLTIDMNVMMKQLTLWGSDEVLSSYLDLIDGYITGKTLAPIQQIDEFCEMFLLIRRELGYENKGIDKFRLYPVFGIHAPEKVPSAALINTAA